MDYEQKFIQGIGSEDVSLTRGLQNYFEDDQSKNWIIAKYGVFLKGVVSSISKRKTILKELDHESAVNSFLFEKFPSVLEKFNQTKGSFRTYLRRAFMNYLIDQTRKKRKQEIWEVLDYQRLFEIGDSEEEKFLYEEYDQQLLKPFFKKLDTQIKKNQEILLLFKYYQALENKNPVLIQPEDLLNFETLVQLWKASEDPISKYIWDHFSFKTKQFVLAFLESKKLNKTTIRAVAKELNYILQEEEFYSKERFKGIKLSGKTKELTQQNPQGKSLFLLNRYLFEDLYPKDISKMSSLLAEEAKKNLTPYERKKTEKLLKELAGSLLQETLKKALAKNEFEEVLQYFFKLYLREKFSVLVS